MAIVGNQIMAEYERFLNAQEDVERYGFVSPSNNRNYFMGLLKTKLGRGRLSFSESEIARLGLKPKRYDVRRFAPSIPFLTDRKMRELIRTDQLIIDPQPSPDQICEATLELRAGGTIFKSDYDLPTKKHVEKYAEKMPSELEYVLEPGHNYFIKSFEEIRLLDDWEGLTHTKSTCGRVGCMCQALDEKYAHIKGVKSGGKPKKIMMSVKPLVFPILIKPKRTRLFQIKISKKGSTYLNQGEVREAYGNDVALFNEGDNLIPLENVLEKNGLKLSLNTKKAFLSKTNAHEPIDLTKKEHYDPHEYFDSVESNDNGELKMDPKRLYLCSSKEKLEIGNKIGVLNREDPHIGPGLWTQLAGFITPGFRGSITFEMWSFYERIMANDSQIGKFFLEELDGKVERDYSARGYYKGQSGPKLAKVFKPW